VSWTNVRAVGVSVDTTIQNSRTRLLGWSFGPLATGDVVFRNGTSVAASAAFTLPLNDGVRSELMFGSGNGILFSDGLFVDIPASVKGTVFFD